ncbi:ornithine cyclodeaminase family protein [Pseudarthrobacter oxydans]|uniref:ornithine cyclodeaminase family protein n=1 Tax=Pseudarthrobacter oxydans TaxID=1671 RepID=UPI002AA612DB|nr:ornithine cyclodeaminase family protein [Pseudarthrobacter oxydans]WPU11063.1 ornithine cyclodeaminase family protein [Pseudarthrobacter oxydans]
MIFLSEHDVSELVDMDDALRAVETALAGQSRGTVHNAIRSRATLNGMNLNLLGGAVGPVNSLAAKIYVTGGGAAKFWLLLFAADGDCDALMEADRIGQLRTGAASGISARYLARKDATVLGLIGSGYQAWTQAEAIVRSTGIKTIQVFSRNYSKAEDFAKRFAEKFPVEVLAKHTIDDALDGADIIATMTSSKESLVEQRHIKAGTHYVFAGSNNPHNREASGDVLAAADLLVTDDRGQAKIEGGTLRRAVAEDAITWDNVGLLGDIVSGEQSGRTSDAQITVFVSQGAGSWDTALARTVFEKAAAKNTGTLLPIAGGITEGRR